MKQDSLTATASSVALCLIVVRISGGMKHEMNAAACCCWLAACVALLWV